MAGHVYASFNAVNTEVGRLRKAGDRIGAFDLLSREESRFPRQRGLIRILRIEVLAEVERTDEAIALLKDGLDQGFHYRGRWLRDDRFATLRAHPDLPALIERADREYDLAQAGTVAELEVITPRSKAPVGGWPLLVALHGNNSELAETVPWWRPAADAGWIVALPQSSEIALTPGVFLWNDTERATVDLERHLASLRRDTSIDDSRAVVAGFSMGGRLALDLVLSGKMPAAGALAVAPWLPDPERLIGTIQAAVAARVRTNIVVGSQDDSGHGGSIRLVEHLRATGCAAEILVHRDGHEYPSTFGSILTEILATF